MPHSILRRYTPPTCTLEIRAKSSPLARWAGQPVVKQLQFQLTLDDPKLPKEEWLTLRGDRAQLEALHEVVSTYVQAFLEQSHSHLVADGGALPAVAIAPTPAATQNAALSTLSANSKAIALRPRGLLSHDLVLGTLATPETTSVVSLSALQLFDLANALDDYAADLVALPELQRSRPSTSVSARWGQIAATGLVVIGLSASVAKIFDSLKPASPTATQEANGDRATQPLAVETPPIASGQPLPPPPPIGSTSNNPGLPTFPLSSPSVSSPKTGNPSIAAIPKPGQTLPGAPRKDAGNQIAMLPQNGIASDRMRSQPAKPIPSLALKRELANAPPNQPASADGRSSASDRSNQADPIGTAFDTIPQVAEARQYFQRHWTPPQGLTQTLEYTLLVGADGSIQRTVPLGQAAGDYVDRTGIPLMGEPFVSASTSGRKAKIRLVLSPDGNVKTFLEGYY